MTSHSAYYYHYYYYYYSEIQIYINLYIDNLQKKEELYKILTFV